MTKNNAASITFRRRLWREWGVWPKSNTMPTYFSRFGRNWPGRGWPGCCGLAGPPKKNRLCNKRPGGRESRARISLLAYGKQADGGEGREARHKTEEKSSWAKGDELFRRGSHGHVSLRKPEPNSCRTSAISALFLFQALCFVLFCMTLFVFFHDDMNHVGALLGHVHVAVVGVRMLAMLVHVL